MSTPLQKEEPKSPYDAFSILLHHKHLSPEERAVLITKAAEVPHIALIARRFCPNLSQEEREILSTATARIPEEICWAYNLRMSCEDLSPNECTLLTREIIKHDRKHLALASALYNHCPNLNNEEIDILRDACKRSHPQAKSATV